MKIWTKLQRLDPHFYIAKNVWTVGAVWDREARTLFLSLLCFAVRVRVLRRWQTKKKPLKNPSFNVSGLFPERTRRVSLLLNEIYKGFTPRQMKTQRTINTVGRLVETLFYFSGDRAGVSVTTDDGQTVNVRVNSLRETRDLLLDSPSMLSDTMEEHNLFVRTFRALSRRLQKEQGRENDSRKRMLAEKGDNSWRL